MNVYLAKIVFRIENKHEQMAQFDEQVRMVRAETPEDAYEKTIYLALAEEGPVNNINGTVFHWAFVGITGLLDIGNLPDKAEIFSHTRETDFAQGYEQHVKEKQRMLLVSINEFSNGRIAV